MDRKEAIASLDRISKTLFFLADFLREEAEKKAGEKERRGGRTEASTGSLGEKWILTKEQRKVLGAFFGLRGRSFDSAGEMAESLSPWADPNSRISILKKKLAHGWTKVRFVLENPRTIGSLSEADEKFYSKVLEKMGEDVDLERIEEELKEFLGKDTTSLKIIS